MAFVRASAVLRSFFERMVRSVKNSGRLGLTGLVLGGILLVGVGAISRYGQDSEGTALEVVQAYRSQNAALSPEEEQATKALQTLLSSLKGRNFEPKGEVLSAIGQIRSSGTIAPLEFALTYKDHSVREKTAWVLGMLKDRRAVGALTVALRDGHWRGQQTVAWALGMIGDGSAVEALVQTLQDGNEDARHGSAWALGKLGDRSAVDALVPLLNDKAADVRHGAAWALGMIGDKRAIEPLKAALNDSDSDVREVVSWALSKLGAQ